MSRIISAIVLSVSLLSLCLFSSLATEHITNDLSADFDAICKNETSRIEDIQTKWSRYNEYASIYLDHEDLEELSLIIASLSEAKELGTAYLKMTCTQALEMLDHISKSERADFSNIF